jgi:hypothetical protein
MTVVDVYPHQYRHILFVVVVVTVIVVIVTVIIVVSHPDSANEAIVVVVIVAGHLGTANEAVVVVTAHLDDMLSPSTWTLGTHFHVGIISTT